jgi:TetR/AcrR family transcriptional repressor of nem operon
MPKGDQTRERLICEMMRLAHRQGFRATPVDDVIEATGVTKGALYHHFPSKDHLGLAALERFSTDFRMFLDQAMGGRTGLDALDGFFAAALDRHRGRAFIGGCPFGNTALEMADGDPRYAEMVAEVFDEWVTRIRDAIADAQQAGEVRDDLAADDLARLVVASVEGGIMQSRLTRNEAPMKGCIESLRALLIRHAEETRRVS